MGKHGKLTKEDARRETGATRREIRQAWHDANEDAQKSGELGADKWDRVPDKDRNK